MLCYRGSVGGHLIRDDASANSAALLRADDRLSAGHVAAVRILSSSTDRGAAQGGVHREVYPPRSQI